jgi:SAM-dependent methyltransferase
MTTTNRIRAEVSRHYAEAVSRGGSCCGGSATPKGVAAKMAGYGADELAALPADAVENSFGCGNPLAFSGVSEGETVLDLGSGAGIDLLIAAQKVGPRGRVIGVDMTDAMIERARANVAASGLGNVEVRKGLIEALPVESGTVDWVISNCVINLSPEKDKVFAEIARVLKPGGRMLVSDIVVDDLPDWVRRSAALYSACVSGAIPEADYLAGLRAAGLIDVAVRERMDYDKAAIAALVASEVEGKAGAAACCGGNMVGKIAGEIAGAIAGKVASVKVFARKPGG